MNRIKSISIDAPANTSPTTTLLLSLITMLAENKTLSRRDVETLAMVTDLRVEFDA